MNTNAARTRYTLITGATGFIGHVLLAELLRRGHACAVLARKSPGATLDTLASLLADLGIDTAALRSAGRLIAIEGSLPDDLPAQLPCQVARIVHSAASTRFEPNSSGDPARTNTAGTASLLEAAERWGVAELHLVSTAFVCGITRGPVAEQVLRDPPEFHNAYEKSKWTAEQLAIRWSERNRSNCTIYRPSIVVGDRSTGRATRFCGLYLALRAIDKAHRSLGNGQAARSTPPLRIEGREEDRMNYIPVDHLARLMTDIIDSPAHHGRVYNLVDAHPPTHRELLQSIEAYYGVPVAHYVEPGAAADAPAGDPTRDFHISIHGSQPYFLAPPEFDRTNVAAAEAHFSRPWPRWDRASIARVIDYARRAGWRARASAPAPAMTTQIDQLDAYFQHFLPEQVARSTISEMTDLTTTLRFIIDGTPNGEWTCRFEQGRLVQVRRGVNGVTEDFAYRLSAPHFWDIVSARTDPQQAFIEGHVEVSGDIEQALKMGMILRQLNSDHPYTPQPAGALLENADA